MKFLQSILPLSMLFGFLTVPKEASAVEDPFQNPDNQTFFMQLAYHILEIDGLTSKESGTLFPKEMSDSDLAFIREVQSNDKSYTLDELVSNGFSFLTSQDQVGPVLKALRDYNTSYEELVTKGKPFFGDLFDFANSDQFKAKPKSPVEPFLSAVMPYVSADGEVQLNEVNFLIKYCNDIGIVVTEDDILEGVSTYKAEMKKMSYRFKAVDLEINVKTIKRALDSYYTEKYIEKYPTAEAYPSCDDTTKRQKWAPESGVWKDLGLSYVLTEVYGCYRIETSEDGKKYIIIGEVDLDGDGKKRIVEATQDSDPTVITDPDVY